MTILTQDQLDAWTDRQASIANSFVSEHAADVYRAAAETAAQAFQDAINRVQALNALYAPCLATTDADQRVDDAVTAFEAETGLSLLDY